MRLYCGPGYPVQHNRNRNQVMNKKNLPLVFLWGRAWSGQKLTFTFVANYSGFTTFSLYNRIYNNERGKKSYRIIWGRGRPAVPLLMPHRDICQVWNVPFHLRFKQTTTTTKKIRQQIQECNTNEYIQINFKNASRNISFDTFRKLSASAIIAMI